MIDQQRNLANKRTVQSLLARVTEATPESLTPRLAAAYHPHAEWRGSHPLDEMRGLDAIERVVWRPLIEAFPDLERRASILIGGEYQDQEQVAAMGHLTGTFRRPWLGIPPSGGAIHIRFGEVHDVVDGRIARSTVLLDVLDVMRQAGIWPVAPSLGLEAMWPGPITGDGLVLGAQDPERSARTLAFCREMQLSLGPTTTTREELFELEQVRYWHPKMMWYGPAGTGTTRGLDGFVDHHQLPFRIAFPDRRPGPDGHYVRLGDGPYAVTGGWPSVVATHLGGDWMGLSPSGRQVGMRVMDFYLVDEGLIRENWVPIDILDLLSQMGVDVLGRVRRQHGTA